LAKLCEAKGKVLLLGSSLRDVTLLHHSEHMAKVSHKPIFRYPVPIVHNGQRKWIEIEEFDTNKPIGNWKGENYFNLITKEALKSRIGCTGQVGAAESFLFDAPALNQFAVQWLEVNLEKRTTQRIDAADP
jgi:aminoglycoside 3-N-acetyltransferase